jgi:cytochrome c oxidase assembly protein subunit 15
MPRSARFAWGVLLWNVAVILWGGFVRATSSGAGCGGHWPTCNGDVVPRSPSVATLIELSHRATSGVAFFAVMALGGVTFFGTPRGHAARSPAVFAMALMLGEVLIGAAIVILGHVALDPSLLHGVFTELHAGNTFLLLTALTLTAHHLGGGARLQVAGRGAVVVSLAWAFAGVALTLGSGAIAALGDTLFPARSLAEGLAQDVSPGSHVFLHVRTMHPVFAVVAFVLVFGACVSIRGRAETPARGRRLATFALVALCFQMALGLLNLWLLVPIATQLLHLASADALFVLLVLTAACALGDGSPEVSDALPPYRTVARG